MCCRSPPTIITDGPPSRSCPLLLPPSPRSLGVRARYLIMLHVAQVKKPTAMRESRANHTRIACDSCMAVGFLTRTSWHNVQSV